MLTAIDHIVIVTRDLDAAVANYRAVGFTVVSGGRHSVATHNALIALEDGAYVELIAFLEPDTREARAGHAETRRQPGGGLSPAARAGPVRRHVDDGDRHRPLAPGAREPGCTPLPGVSRPRLGHAGTLRFRPPPFGEASLPVGARVGECAMKSY